MNLKPRILSVFLLRRFLYGVGLVLLIVAGIIFAVTFVERLPSNPTAVDAMAESWTRLMEYIPLFLPLAVFMGTLVASYNLTKSTESIIVSSAGLSPYQSARPFLFGATLLGIIATTLLNPYAVRLSTQTLSANHLKLVDDAIWLREGTRDGFVTMRATQMHRRGPDLEFANANIFIQDSEFHLTQRVNADTVVLSDDGLTAPNATVMENGANHMVDVWRRNTLITPQTVLDRYLQPDQISFWQLPKFISKMESIGVPTRGHQVQFWTLLFMPLTMIAMATLGVAFSQTHQRRNYSFGVKFSLGIVTCFGLYFLVNMFNALGTTGTLPPILAIVAPQLIIIAAAGTFITSFDTI